MLPPWTSLQARPGLLLSGTILVSSGTGAPLSLFTLVIICQVNFKRLLEMWDWLSSEEGAFISNSFLLPWNMSFTLLLIFLMVFYCVFLTPLNDFFFLFKSKEPFWNYAFFMFCCVLVLFCFRVYLENKFISPNWIDLVCFTVMESTSSNIPAYRKLVLPGLLMKIHRTEKWNVNLENRCLAWNLAVIVWTAIGAAVRKSKLWNNSSKC